MPSDSNKIIKILKKNNVNHTVDDITGRVAEVLETCRYERAEQEVYRSIQSGTTPFKTKEQHCEQCGDRVVPDSDLDCPECGWSMLNCVVDMERSVNYYMKKGKVKLYAA